MTYCNRGETEEWWNPSASYRRWIKCNPSPTPTTWREMDPHIRLWRSVLLSAIEDMIGLTPKCLGRGWCRDGSKNSTKSNEIPWETWGREWLTSEQGTLVCEALNISRSALLKEMESINIKERFRNLSKMLSSRDEYRKQPPQESKGD